MIQSICVCGAGTMGSGIAQVAAQSGFPTILFDVNEAVLAKAKAGIEKQLQTLETKGKPTADERQALTQPILYTHEYQEVQAQLAFEAIIEQQTAKVALFQQLVSVNGTGCIFASNTSSLSITALQEELPANIHFAGMHFFNPAPLMKLVEVVEGKYTGATVTQQLCELTTRLNKTPVVCKDAPGFIVNRVARHYYLEAMHMAGDHAINISTIDAVLESAGFKMGPFKLMDMIGLDINYSVSNIVWDALGKPARLQPSSLQKAKVEAGELGRKSGKGFYNYDQ